MASISSALANCQIAFFIITVQTSIPFPEFRILLPSTIIQTKECCAKYNISTTKDKVNGATVGNVCHSLILHMSINMHTPQKLHRRLSGLLSEEVSGLDPARQQLPHNRPLRQPRAHPPTHLGRNNRIIHAFNRTHKQTRALVAVATLVCLPI